MVIDGTTNATMRTCVDATLSQEKSGMSGSFCAAYGCSNNRKKDSELSFFSFPKDEER